MPKALLEDYGYRMSYEPFGEITIIGFREFQMAKLGPGHGVIAGVHDSFAHVPCCPRRQH
jgi:hypothetical protein